MWRHGWRVAGWTLERGVVTLDLLPIAAGAGVQTASPGRPLPSPDEVHGPTRIEAFELPALDEAPATRPAILVAACGELPGWRGAALLLSGDGGLSWTDAGRTAAPATMGRILAPPAPAAATLADRAGWMEVELAHEGMALSPAADALLDGGANLALTGGELIQFGEAVATGSRRWRLGRLWRGRRGTEAAIGTQRPGDRFVLLTPATVRRIDLSPGAAATGVRVQASGIGDADDAPAQAVAVSGASVTPPCPVHLSWQAGADGGGTLRWVRRSRLGWSWADGGDAPLGEERERYRVLLHRADGGVRAVETAQPELALAPGDRGAAPMLVEVRQAGTHGLSPAAFILLPPLEQQP